MHHKQRGGSRSLSRKLRAAWRKWHRYGFPLAHTAAIVQDACVINCPERERARECVCVRVYARALARSIQASIQMAFSHPTKNQMAPKQRTFSHPTKNIILPNKWAFLIQQRTKCPQNRWHFLIQPKNKILPPLIKWPFLIQSKTK